MWDRTGETQVYVQWQKAAEEQKRFDKAKTLSCLASRDHPATLYPLRPITGNPRLFRARNSLMGSGDLAATCLVSRALPEKWFLAHFDLSGFRVCPASGCGHVGALDLYFETTAVLDCYS